jgi:sulfide:quinone oxidoreductase
MKKFDVLIIGGGTAGITVAARIRNRGHFKNIGIIDPSSWHYYQPLWTLVGSGQVNKEDTRREMKAVIPNGVTWIQDEVIQLEPEANQIRTKLTTYSYQYLVMATGIVPDWSFAEGLSETIGKNHVCSVYSYQTSDYCYDLIQNLSEGEMLFSMPGGMLKCGGAPQKILWLLEDYCRRHKKRKNFNFHFLKETTGIFGVEKYKKILEKMVIDREINTHFNEVLTRVDGSNRKAFFKDSRTGELKEYLYDFLHVVPHFKTHDFISSSKLANQKGEIAVDPHTLQSIFYKNIFSLGDCSSCPTGKTGAAIRKQAPVLVENLHDFEASRPMSRSYNGYTACPILTKHNRVILAEFDYDGNPMESFPFNQAKERFSMYLFKRYLLPWAYWNLMLKGRM